MSAFLDSVTAFKLKARGWLISRTRKLLKTADSKLSVATSFLFCDNAIFGFRDYCRSVSWTRERQKEFDEYWLENYGSKIGSEWHRFYEGLTGSYSPNFFPTTLYSPNLARKINNMQLAAICDSKTMLPYFFNNAELGRKCIPDHYAYRIQGYFYDKDRNVVSCEELSRRVANVGPCVLKAAGEMQGKGVIMLDLKDGRDVKTGKSALELFKLTKGDFVLQERVTEHSALTYLSPNSLNTIRVTTYICEDVVCRSPILVRLGIGASPVDNFHAGGLAVGVRDDGTLLKTALQIDSRHLFTKQTINPNTGEPFEGYKLPFIDRVIDFVTKNHGRIPGIGMVSWDLILTEDGDPMVIEVNVSKQNIAFIQYVHGPIFGDNTPKMLKLIRK